MRYKVIVEYDGNNYVGFQSQINGLAIQDVIEKALQKIFLKDIRIIMSSRTDAGVHAKGQVFHFDDEKELIPSKLKNGINNFLPKDIHVTSVEHVSKEFHARFSVKTKEYHYYINLGEYDVFLNGRAYQCFYKLDIDLMKKGASIFAGKHDFGSFNTTPYSEKANQVRDIKYFKIIQKKDLLIIKVKGTGFLKNMVRIMVGSLIDLARGKKSLEEIQDMLEHPNKTTKRYNAPACGLYLMKVNY